MKFENRSGRERMAQQTLEILKEGSYLNTKGITTSIENELNKAIEHSMLYRPAQLEDSIGSVRDLLQAEGSPHAVIEVTSETSLQAAYRMVVLEKQARVTCLNFASAKNPGGGFLSGSLAQEESLARSSGLYSCISQFNEMYEHNRNNRSAFCHDQKNSENPLDCLTTK